MIDELHIYRGIFGSHPCQRDPPARPHLPLLRRQPRVHLLFGHGLNPREHAEKILERPAALLDKSAAPAAAKTFVLYNPPIVNRELGIRQSAMTPRKIASDLIGNHIQTIVFATSRLNVEVLTKYLKDKFVKTKPLDDHFVTCAAAAGICPTSGATSKAVCGRAR